jgi:hypothetical protein
VSLNPRAIATLGVGFGAVSIAYLGLWPIGTPVEPPTEEAYRPRPGAPFVVAYQPELPEVLLRLEVIEARDTARILIGAGPLDAVAGLLVTERPDGAGVALEVEASMVMALAETPDGAVLAAAVDWSDDDEDVLEMLMTIATTT